MDLQVQKVLLRTLSKAELAEMFPVAEHWQDSSRDVFCRHHDPSHGWLCTRPKGHEGLHIRHKLTEATNWTTIDTHDVPIAWLNDETIQLEQAQDA